MAKVDGHYYLADVRPHISKEESTIPVLERDLRKSNSYSGTLPSGLTFRFSWGITEGEVSFRGLTSQKNFISWLFEVQGGDARESRERVGSPSGDLLQLEISRAEANRASAAGDGKNRNLTQEARVYRNNLEASVEAGTYVIVPGIDLNTYILTLP